MKVWIYVEGESDSRALDALWKNWKNDLKSSGHGISIHPLDSKSQFFKKIGPHAAQKLADNNTNLVVGLPDLYPNRGFENTPYKHDDLNELKRVQRDLVKNSLEQTQGIRRNKIDTYLERFFPSALKHDLEMLLLAAIDQLRETLGTRDALCKWTKPVENQNQMRPPKSIVEELFRTKTPNKRSYRDTKDAPSVLRKVKDLNEIIFLKDGKINCPVFKEMIDRIGKVTEIPAYQKFEN